MAFVRSPGILLECGLFQGRRSESRERNRNLPVHARKANAVILSHAHIDHSGALPSLVHQGWHGTVHATPATRDLAEVMLRDSGHIQEKDAEYLNKKRPNGWKPVDPIYTERDAEKTMRYFRTHEYGEEFEPLRGVTARFVDAGHILGSAAIHLTVREKRGTTRLVFTGDLGRPGLPLIRDPEPAGPADIVLTESTYGDRDHEPPEDTENGLMKVVNRTCSRGGRVVIPAFAVGRTQAIIYMLHRLRSSGRIDDLPIYVDSPMAVRATRIFSAHSGLFDEEASEFLEGRGRLFAAARTAYVSSAADSKRLNELEGPSIILSASGMCEAGRILHHLRHTLGNPANTVLFVGYQAEHTLGRRILEGSDEVKLFREPHAVRCEVAKLNGLSAHADRGGLETYLRSLGGPRRRTFLVHGDTSRCESFRDYLQARGHQGVTIPKARQKVDLEEFAS
ncbi:MAG: MBL fold metallo-hydrolase RNA specificity domain-containing protein [Planctomycetota bacterium]